jgi:hypothetical protein
VPSTAWERNVAEPVSEKRICCAAGERVSQTLSASFPGKPGKDRRYCTGNEQHKRRTAQPIAHPFGARTSIATQRRNYVTNDIREHSRGQKRNREMVNNRMQMVFCNETFHGNFGLAPFLAWGERDACVLLRDSRERPLPRMLVRVGSPAVRAWRTAAPGVGIGVMNQAVLSAFLAIERLAVSGAVIGPVGGP